jgi:hypothetical protein
MSIFRNCLFQWTVRNYKTYGFGGGSFCFRSSSSCLSPKGLANHSLVFVKFLALWFLLPPLKLESIEVGLSTWVSSNFSFNPRSNYGVLLVGQSKIPSTRCQVAIRPLLKKFLHVHGAFCFRTALNPNKGREVVNNLFCKENTGEIHVARKWG